MFINIMFRFGSDRPSGLIFFRARFTSFHIHASHITFCVGFFILFVYYCIRLSFNTLFYCFFAEFLLFSPNGSVTGCDFSLESFCYSRVYFLRVCIEVHCFV